MNRQAERMNAALSLMEVRGRATAAELASELRVSVATIRRDLAALADAGVPVRPRRGRGGGWALADRRWLVDPYAEEAGQGWAWGRRARCLRP